jgi:hypothetical protein
MKCCEVMLLRKVRAQCKVRRARFIYAGRAKWGRFHNCCEQCYRTNWDQMRAVTGTQNRNAQLTPWLQGTLIVPEGAKEERTFVEVAASQQHILSEAQPLCLI